MSSDVKNLDELILDLKSLGIGNSYGSIKTAEVSYPYVSWIRIGDVHVGNSDNSLGLIYETIQVNYFYQTIDKLKEKQFVDIIRKYRSQKLAGSWDEKEKYYHDVYEVVLKTI